MTDPTLFTAGNLFTADYLTEGIRQTAEYLAVEVAVLRTSLIAITEAFPQAAHPNEMQTEDDLIWPVLAAIGWTNALRQQNLTIAGREDVPDGLLFTDAEAKARANALLHEYRRYGEGTALVESKRWNRPLDRAGRRDESSAPSTQMLRYLRRVDDLTRGRLRWGILTNGARWRLYWAGARSVSEEFLDIDLARVLGLTSDDLFAGPEDRDHWLRVFAVLFGRAAFVPGGTDALTFHARALRQSAFYEERVAANLAGLVFTDVFPRLAGAIAAAAPAAPLQEVREATLVLLYRLLFLLYAEDRELLPVRDRRYDDYALRPLRLEVGRRLDENDAISATATRMWSQIADLSRMIDKGDPSVGLPPYNGGLFAGAEDGGGTPLLDRVRLPDSVMAATVDALSFEQTSGQRRYINYRDLSVQQLGSIYERLLEHELTRDDGRLVVRPNAFARKNSGSYYTPDALVALILDQTLEPLLAERRAAFAKALAGLRSADSEDARRRELRSADPAAAILDLKVLDPAMGSGHFLVSLVDVLTEAVLLAMDEVGTAGAPLDHRSPLADDIVRTRDRILAAAKAANWTIDEAQLDDRHIVRRMVLKRCVYGVDKNPMAVELAKVSLWLHSFTVGAPLSFIDHHLRAGDSLFGLWVRDAMDKAARRGGGELLFADAIRNATRSAVAMRTIEALTDAEIAEAHRSAEMYSDVELMTGDLDGFVSFVNALDWLGALDTREQAAVRALLDGLFGDPIAIVAGKTTPHFTTTRFEEEDGERMQRQAFNPRELLQPALDILRRAKGIGLEERFFNWQVAFPGVWTDWSSGVRHGGFDAVIGNPPWDRMKLQQVEWFAARKPEIARETRAADRTRMVEALKTVGDPLAYDFATADQRAASGLRMARSVYPLLGRGDVNIYSLFVERAHALAKPDGLIGLVVPIGIGTDKNSSNYVTLITSEKRLKAFISFENKHRWLFQDVHAEDQPSALIVTNKARTYDEFNYAVKLHEIPPRGGRQLPVMSKETLAIVNPNTGTLPIFRTSQDARLVTTIYSRMPVLVSRSESVAGSGWNLRYFTMFHMTNDSSLFRTISSLEETEGAWPVGAHRYQSAAGLWLPLYEGKSIQIYNHRYASVVTPFGSISGQGQAVYSTIEQLQDSEFTTTPRYWVAADKVHGNESGYAIGFNDICNTNNARSLIAAIIPRVATGNKLPLLLGLTANESALIVGNLNSIIGDFAARNKIQSRNLNKYIIEQLPVAPAVAYERSFGDRTAADIVRASVLELSYTAHDLAAFARDLGYTTADGQVRPPFRWDEDRRLKLRSRLDALYFILYGVTDRDDVRYIFSTFPVVEREEMARWHRYRHRDLTLAWINALLAGHPDAEIDL